MYGAQKLLCFMPH